MAAEAAACKRYDLDDGRHSRNDYPDYPATAQQQAAGEEQVVTVDVDGRARLTQAAREMATQHLHKLLHANLHSIEAAAADCHAECGDSVYTGRCGLAYACWHLARSGTLPQAASSRLLHTARSACEQLVSGEADDSATARRDAKRPSFLCGRAGPLALGCVLLWPDNRRLAQSCLRRLVAMATPANAEDSSVPNELLYGRAGYLYSLAFVAWQLGDALGQAERQLLAEAAAATAARLLQQGRRLWRHCVRKGQLPNIADRLGQGVWFEWHDSAYFGAAHGVCGIAAVLHSVGLDQLVRDYHSSDPGSSSSSSSISSWRQHVQHTMQVLRAQQHSSGNYPSSLGSTRDRLVHWCHGAPGFALALLRLGEVDAARECGEVIWHRGLLHKGDGLCHGVAGNAYVFLRLHAVTGEARHLHRAVQFASFMARHWQRRRQGDRPLSLFEGVAGTMCFFADLLRAELCCSSSSSSSSILFPAAELPHDFHF